MGRIYWRPRILEIFPGAQEINERREDQEVSFKVRNEGAALGMEIQITPFLFAQALEATRAAYVEIWACAHVSENDPGKLETYLRVNGYGVTFPS